MDINCWYNLVIILKMFPITDIPNVYVEYDKFKKFIWDCPQIIHWVQRRVNVWKISLSTPPQGQPSFNNGLCNKEPGTAYPSTDC